MAALCTEANAEHPSSVTNDVYRVPVPASPVGRLATHLGLNTTTLHNHQNCLL